MAETPKRAPKRATGTHHPSVQIERYRVLASDSPHVAKAKRYLAHVASMHEMEVAMGIDRYEAGRTLQEMHANDPDPMRAPP